MHAEYTSVASPTSIHLSSW